MLPDLFPKVAVTVVVPRFTAVANPSEPDALLTETTDVSAELHVTCVVRSWMVLSEYVPVAVYCRVNPLAMLWFVGVTEIELSVAAVTVSSVSPKTLPRVALTVVNPTPTAAARPSESAALLMVAMVSSDELHVTCVVRSWVVLSEYIPVAVYCKVNPLGRLWFVGVTSIELSVAAVTVSWVFPDLPSKAAVMVVEPTLMAVASPSVPAALLTATTVSLEEVHATCVVRSWVVLSEYMPVAVNCKVNPLAMLWMAGVTSIELSVAAVTVNEVSPKTLSRLALIVVEPILTAAATATPSEPAALLMVATPTSEELHVTCVVRSCLVLSE